MPPQFDLTLRSPGQLVPGKDMAAQTLRVDEGDLSGLAYENSRRFAIYFELSRLCEAQ